MRLVIWQYSTIGILATVLAAPAAAQKNELTFAEFRALLRQQAPASAAQPDLERTGKDRAAKDRAAEARAVEERVRDERAGEVRAGRVFFRLLAAQGKAAAARQSVDRLTGWYQTAQTRVQAQSAPASDADLLRFAQARAASRLAQFEAERLRNVQRANQLLKRPPNTPLVALFPEPPPESAAAQSTASRPPEKPSEKIGDVSPDIAGRRAQFEKELLPAGHELLTKLYQSYLFGGAPLTTLLWQEQQVYRTDLDYRLLLVESARAAAQDSGK